MDRHSILDCDAGEFAWLNMAEAPYVLVVDNNPDAQALMAAWVRKLNFPVQVAGDGVEALAHIHERSPGLVILDLKMPGMDGFRLLDLLKHDPEKHDIPVLVLTGGSLEAKVKAQLREVAIDVVQKGGDLEYVGQLIKKVLKGANTR